MSQELESKEGLRKYLNDASDQFLDDLSVIFQKFQNDEPAKDLLGELVSEIYFSLLEKMWCSLNQSFQVGILWKKVKRDENSKITVQGMKDFLAELKEQFSRNSEKQQNLIDSIKTMETALSTQLPSERYNGIMNLLRLLSNPDAPTEEIEKSLVNYSI